MLLSELTIRFRIHFQLSYQSLVGRSFVLLVARVCAF